MAEAESSTDQRMFKGGEGVMFEEAQLCTTSLQPELLLTVNDSLSILHVMSFST